MKVFCVDTGSVLNGISVKEWVNDLMEKGAVMGGSVESVITRHTIHQATQQDGTRLDVMYIDSDNDALLINYQDGQIIQGNFLVGYKPSFGNPLPFIKRIVISMEGLKGFDNLANISVSTDYMAVEAEVERLQAEAHKPAPKLKPKKKASVVLKAKAEMVVEKKTIAPKEKAKPTINQLAPKSKVITSKYVQQSLF